MSAAIIDQARAERRSYGDEPFFRRLNAGETGQEGWGDLKGTWDAATFEEAATAAPNAEVHLRLVSALLKTVASSHAEVISHRGGNFVRFDVGLSILSKHARDLGYDALVLFLDELILWLAMNSTDHGFVKREIAKLTNLVEAQSADRPIPLVSFVARQRDLRELVGDHVPGAERMNLGDSLDWQQGRFDTITLEDRNLPAIAEKRVLRCKSAAARQELDAAFDHVAGMRDSVMNILLTQEGDRQMFRRVFPFSPALVQTLIAVSSVLQRERTALKVMMQLLVDQRDTLAVGDIVPVGDLFDVIAHGDEAFSQEMAIHFDNAKRLYHQKLLRMLEKQHGMRVEQIEQLANDDPKRIAFRTDDRLIKTLLLSALVPEVESLRGLTAERLAALNHGTIKTPIKGHEGQEVLRRCRQWRASVGEIRISEGDNPTISVQLSGVDTEAIIEQARREDNTGNRIRRVRQMLFEQLGIEGEAEFEQYHEFPWRNTKRDCVVLFKNVRELPDSSLANVEGSWKLVIDFPFDEGDHGPRSDLSRLQRFAQAHPGGAKTICWVPSFFSREAEADLGMLVILEHILTGERFGQFSQHLSPQERPTAKSLLESQRNGLRQRVQSHLDAAYGLDALLPDSLDAAHDLEASERYCSLLPGFAPQPPAAANLAGAMHGFLSQALEHEFPGAPRFEAECKLVNLKKVYELILPATQTVDGRAVIDRPLRQLVRQIANPLHLGDMGMEATHFVLGQHWKTHFGRKAAETGAPMTVDQLRHWIDDPKPMGLPKEAQNLVILLFAAQTNRTLYLHGAPYEGSLTTVPDPCELRTVNLPDAATWDAAIRRAGNIFGIAVSPLLSAGNVASLTSELKKRASAARSACGPYARQLRDRLVGMGMAGADADRLKTAQTTQALLERLEAAEVAATVSLIVTADVATSEAAMGECVNKSAELEVILDAAGWDLFEAIGKLADDRRGKAEEIIRELRETLARDEHVRPLASALKGAQAKAVRLLTEATQLPLAPEVPMPPVVAPAQPGRRIVEQDSRHGLTLADAKSSLADLDQRLKPGQTARVDVGWVVEEGEAT
jgi:hypothetical protein